MEYFPEIFVPIVCTYIAKCLRGSREELDSSDEYMILYWAVKIITEFQQIEECKWILREVVKNEAAWVPNLEIWMHRASWWFKSTWTLIRIRAHLSSASPPSPPGPRPSGSPYLFLVAISLDTGHPTCAFFIGTSNCCLSMFYKSTFKTWQELNSTITCTWDCYQFLSLLRSPLPSPELLECEGLEGPQVG